MGRKKKKTIWPNLSYVLASRNLFDDQKAVKLYLGWVLRQYECESLELENIERSPALCCQRLSAFGCANWKTVEELKLI